MKEVWKTVFGFDDYLVSNCGRVKTKSRKLRYLHAVTGNEHFRISEERLMKVYKNDNTGYKFVQLYKNKKSKNKTIHRLVAETFIPNPDSLCCVNHMDGNKHNNRIDNLEWCTNEYNHRHATETGLIAKGVNVASSKLNDRCVYAIKELLKIGFSHSQVAEVFNVSRSTITLINTNKTWVNALTGKELELSRKK